MSQSDPKGSDLATSVDAHSNRHSVTDTEYADPPPSYGESLGRIVNEHKGLGAKAKIAADGRVNIRINQDSKGLSSLLVPALRSQLDLTAPSLLGQQPYVPPELERGRDRPLPPPLNITIHVVGSRGDVQPFVALGKVLKEEHGHRVRLATHLVFKDFVEENGVEFFNIGGDPSQLMAFMVKNPGLMPGFDSLRAGDVGRRRREIATMLEGCWQSCIEAGNGIKPEDLDTTDSEAPAPGDVALPPRPFVADAIIANPPSFAGIHCAERLGIPLHMMFTMPWSPTQSFPHPLANIQSSNADANMTNLLSYTMVEMMTWQGLGDVINQFRSRTLGLEHISLTWAPGMLARLHVPFTYCWSPALIPKPQDWGSYIDIAGFYFLDLGGHYTPADDLKAFLDAGPPPVYIGFGSIVVDEPNTMTKLIFDAVRKTGQRALVSKGWGGFGADQIGIPEGVFMLGNVPHDWLFKRVSCVVHHGGAGTSAAGIASGKPTIVVPFFGDQPFWGAMVARAGAGPAPIPNKSLTSDNLAAAIQEALTPGMQEKAQELSRKISQEQGCKSGCYSFHRQLDVDSLRCQLSPRRAAVWRIRRTNIRLSAFAATVLHNEKLLHYRDLKLYRSREYEVDDGPWDPITGGATSVIETMASMAMGIADLPVATLKAMRIHPDASKNKDATGRSRSNTARSRSSTNRSRSNTADSYATAPHSPRARSHSDVSNTPASPGSPHLGSPDQARPVSSLSGQSQDAQAEESALAAEIADQMAAHHMQERDPLDPQGTKQQKPFQFNREDLDNVVNTGRGAIRFVNVGLKSPMDFTLALAKGFHNAPKLYGDDTVRQTEKVNDFASGLKVAGKEFGYGMYDGITGLVTQPIQGARKEGAAGFVKGIGKGLGGIVFKPGAAAWGIPGYMSQGIYKELKKKFGPSVEAYVIAARTAQGFREFQESTPEERATITADWKEMRNLIYIKKSVGEEQIQEKKDQLELFRMRMKQKYGLTKPDEASQDVGGGRPGMSRFFTNGTTGSSVYSPEGSHVDTDPLQRHLSSQPPAIRVTQAEEDRAFEEAIQRSITQTSTGDSLQDEAIEKAIRASVQELRAAKARGASQGELAQTMEASIERTRSQDLYAATAAHEQEASTNTNATPSEDGASQHTQPGHEEDQDLQQALEESRLMHESDQAKQEREEQIVMQYVMKQSLLEEELRQKNSSDEAKTE